MPFQEIYYVSLWGRQLKHRIVEVDRTTGTIEVIKVDIGAFADATMYTI